MKTNSILKLVVFSLCAFFLYEGLTYGATEAVSTFESIGLYWSPAGGSSSREAQVKYRPLGNSSWKTGLSLWYDGRAIDDRPAEYRGSLVLLNPGTTYEIMLSLVGTNTSTTFTAATWSEDFPIAKTIYLPESSSSTYVISESGTANGYVLYTSSPGKTATIDVNNNYNNNIRIGNNVHHVIIRGLILKGAKNHAINLGTFNYDVVIEENDISGWGDGVSSGMGYNGEGFQSAIWGRGDNDNSIERIIIQRNKMYNPQYDTNSWYECANCRLHPSGPQAISLHQVKGNYVVRYNEIYSDNGNYFNDGLGGDPNFSFSGFPNRDSDIYGNTVSQTWDDGIESEGANMNVRIWGNYIDNTLVGIAIATVSKGPIYIWRNIGNRSRERAYTSNSDDWGRGTFIKAGGSPGGGRTYVFHNYTMQSPPSSGQSYPLGYETSIGNWGGPFTELITRNNILLSNRGWTVFSDGTNSCTNDWDYDLYNGGVSNNCRSQQSNGIRLNGTWPQFDPQNGPGEFALAAGAQGYDAGTVIPNFNDGFIGSAPDMGAFEAGSTPMEFGVDAYLTSSGNPPTTCTSFTYTPWGACQSNSTQTRTTTSSSPSGCTGGTPTLNQSCTYTPPSTYQCSDGIDNDGDGLIDYPLDPGCVSTSDNDEYSATGQSLANSNTMIANSENFALNREVGKLWDGITDTEYNSATQAGSTGAGNIASFWIEFDFGQNYNLTQARLFGDAVGTWRSDTWKFQNKQDINDSWTTAFENVNALFNGWSEQSLEITARYVRVEVFGNSASSATQAWELEIYGTPSSGGGDLTPPAKPLVLKILGM